MTDEVGKIKVNLHISKDVKKPYADIHVNELTENIIKAITLLENNESMELLPVHKNEDIVLLEYDDIFMFRVEEKRVKVYTQNEIYLIKKALYQLEEDLNESFVRISKSTIINLRKIKRVAPSIKGIMFIEMKNGLKDNISRKYMPSFKAALDL